MALCPSCGATNREGRKFCSDCGRGLDAACPACGAANEPGERFCGECGAPLTASGATVAAEAALPREPPAAERRLVSVLFADLVGFTALSEARDAEEVRELLSRYFATCRRLITLYGGTVEKFIGDAVMAVWGTPTATEDDAERAVRAGLDLVAAVSALGQEVGAETLQARAGILTGEAAVTIGATGEGMVAGDLVNTASRIQSAASPGTVLVGDATRRSTERTIVYEAAGTFALKGKDGSTPLWRAQRVVSGLRGALKSHGLEAPFVGRDRDLRRIKDLFHVSADEGRAQLVSVTGIAGIGKSRLAWEFYKYFDGIAETVHWHRGRCLAYGEGVTYWALADMVRMRCRIAEDETPPSALAKLRATLAEHVTDPSERSFLEPRVAHLLGLGEHRSHDRQDLFGAWRLFFERLADRYPTVLAFEDLHWADSALLDFIEYLLDWSRASPLFVITLARPELLERRPTWGAGQRSFTALYLEPLAPATMRELVTGLVPGLPDALREQILERAEGVPLYAVETVRMLLDRGVLVEDGPVYRLTGAVGELAVPETLHALIAARLDGLSPTERRLLGDAAVLGKTFTAESLRAVSGSGDGVEQALSALVRKEVLGVQADPRSPERGQYGFLQDLVRHVAYGTLSRRERRTRHLAAAEYLRGSGAIEEGEIVEVLAAHYLAADEAVPDAADAPAIRAQAREMLTRAGGRAEALAAADAAGRYFTQAGALADDPHERAALLARAGLMASRAGQPDAARGLLIQAIEQHEALGDTHAAARVLWRLARIDTYAGRAEAAIAQMERAYAVISDGRPDEELALLAVGLSFAYWYAGDIDRAAVFAERALEIAEADFYPEALAMALRASAYVSGSRSQPEVSFALMKHSLQIALDHDLTEEASVSYFNLSDQCFRRDRYVDALAYLDEALPRARRLGNRPYEWATLAERTYPQLMLGRWDEVQTARDDVTAEQVDAGGVMLSLLQSAVEVSIQRGQLDAARRTFALYARLDGATDRQDLVMYTSMRAATRRAEGRLEEALVDAEAALALRDTLGLAHQGVKQAFVEAVEAASALGDTARVTSLLADYASSPSGVRPPFLEAQARRFQARLSGDAADYQAAAERFRQLGVPFWRAVTLLEHAERLAGDGRSEEADPLLDEAAATFEELCAAPWIVRTAAIARTHTSLPS